MRKAHHEDIAGAVGDVDMGGLALLLVAVHHAELGHLQHHEHHDDDEDQEDNEDNNEAMRGHGHHEN